MKASEEGECITILLFIVMREEEDSNKSGS